jgi:hypothetical protein
MFMALIPPTMASILEKAGSARGPGFDSTISYQVHLAWLSRAAWAWDLEGKRIKKAKTVDDVLDHLG